MKKAVWSGIIAVGVLALSTSAYAQQATANGTVNVSATVNAKAKLSINNASSASISFGDFDPDTNTTISATPLNIDVKARTSGTVTLTVRATQDLTSTTVPTDTIGIAALKWTSTGTNFAPTGISSTAAEVNVMSFAGSGNHSGVQTYALDNSWAYKSGTYTTSLTYTLTAP